MFMSTLAFVLYNLGDSFLPKMYGLNCSCGSFKDRRDFLTVEACSVGGGEGSSGLTC